ECNLHTIVRLPNGVFAPYTGIKTNLLFFEKGTPTKDIWYFEHPYPEGVKNYNKSKPINLKEFDLEKKWWSKRLESANAWKISIEEIKKRGYNLDIKNPTTETAVQELYTHELLAQVSMSFEKSSKLLEQLKTELL